MHQASLVPLYESNGFEPLHCNYSTQKPEAERVDTIQCMLKEAMRSSENLPSSSDDDDDGERLDLSDEDEVPPRPTAGSDSRPKPIYDPLGGPPAPHDPAVQKMHFFDFLLWDQHCVSCPRPEGHSA